MSRDNASVTPQVQADFLEKFAHCIGVTNNTNSPITEKYFVYNVNASYSYPQNITCLDNVGFRVIYNNGEAVQVIKHTAEEIKIMAKCNNPNFN